MAATVPARRALSDMSVNTPIGNTPQKSSKSGLEVCPESTSLSKTGGKLFGEIESKSQNELGVVANSAKRRRVDTEDGQRREFLSSRGEIHPTTLSRSVSPSSSFGNTTVDMNDTQNTVLTIPDEGAQYNAFAPPPIVTSVPQLTTAQMRAKATSIRLRLTLASYKLRTNQVDVPISRLEIRPSQTPNLSQLKRTASNSGPTSGSTNNLAVSSSKHFPTSEQRSFEGRRTALPSAPSSTSVPASNPGAQNFTPAYSEQGVDVSSSPPASNTGYRPPVSPVKGREGELEEFTTPILPRQRAGLINPPFLGSRDEDMERDLTSSVVKGRAADGLLQLMGIRE